MKTPTHEVVPVSKNSHISSSKSWTWVLSWSDYSKKKDFKLSSNFKKAIATIRPYWIKRGHGSSAYMYTVMFICTSIVPENIFDTPRSGSTPANSKASLFTCADDIQSTIGPSDPTLPPCCWLEGAGNGIGSDQILKHSIWQGLNQTDVRMDMDG